MNNIQAKSLIPGVRVKYVSPASATRTTGSVYTITSVSGKFIKHTGDSGTVVEGHVDQYQLVDPIELPVMPVQAPEKSTPAPAPKKVVTTPEEIDFKQVLKDNQDLSTKITAMALEQGQRLAKDMINSVQSQLDNIKRQSCQTLQVQVNDYKTVKLSSGAVPYLKRMIISAKIGKNIMLVGPAGCGKTTAAAQLSEALQVMFYHNTVTAGASETWFLGRQTPVGFQPGPLHLAYKNGGVYLADEYDAGDANLLIMFNTMLENGHFYNPFNGEMIKRHQDFVFIAACNTYGKGADATYTGRNRLDAASLRRFAGSTIAVDYNEDIERLVCPDDFVRTALQKVRAELKSKSSTEIISTGCLKNTFDLMQQGIPFKDIAQSLCLSWPVDLKTLMDTAVKSVEAGTHV